MKRTATLLYGTVAYVGFLGAFLYAIAFVSDLPVPRSIDRGPAAPLTTAIVIDTLLLALFGLQHSIMARRGFKKLWTRIVPEPIERSTFVVATCLVLGLLFWQWRPIPELVWKVDSVAGSFVLWSIACAGYLLVLLSTFVIDHFHLFGLKQVYFYFRGKPCPQPEFHVRAFYRVVRHPLMLGFLIAFWATPQMTAGHLLFAVVTTLYILVAVQLEERDLAHFHGGAYAEYRKRVAMLLPFVRAKRSAQGRPVPAATQSDWSERTISISRL